MRREYAAAGCVRCTYRLALRHDNQGLGFGLAPAYAHFRTAQIALVSLDCAQKPVPSRPNHGPLQLVQAGPGSLVAAPSKHLLEPQRADAILLAGHQRHGAKPGGQRSARILEDGSRSGRNLMTAADALPTPGTQRPSLDRFTTRKAETLRLAQLKQILAASLLVAETSFQFSQLSGDNPHSPSGKTLQVGDT